MENSVGSTIEKIKLQEQDKEARLKEKRELEATKANLSRNIRDALTQTEKIDQETAEHTKKLDHLRAQLEIKNSRRDALAAQVEAWEKQLEDLRRTSDEGMSKVWNTRASLCEAVQSVSDECDVWALLMKPTCPEPLPRPKQQPDEDTSQEDALKQEALLKAAVERRDMALAEKQRLLLEPDNGEEFIRIKNALRYSLEMVTNLKK